MTSTIDDYADMTLAEHEVIEARLQYASAYARHYGVTRLGHDDRHAMPLAAARARLVAAGARFAAEKRAAAK